ncbi:hypothetical protein CAEBREN_28889 [Caenorhabditis brenneri]|uniref:Uncharacterized protein n=1 Tax=Caenorhabditis brenneri TaxID=135651 RepID=G0NEK6_CAEBE|nr:hypothetical protein CAEBREN_28889 [Caenorhabditis brenneri]
MLITLTWYCMRTKDKVDVLRIPYPSANVTINTSKRYLSSNLASICQLGNHIFEFASLYGLAKRLNRKPKFFIENGSHRKMLEKGKSIIPGLVRKFLVINGSVPHTIGNTSFQPTCCSYDDPMKLENSQDEYLHLSGMFYQSWKYFVNMKEELSSYLNDAKFMNFGSLPRSNPKTHV